MIALDDIKRDLRVTDNDSDDLLTKLLSASIDEACKFMDREELPGAEESSGSSSEDALDSVSAAIMLFVRAKYSAVTPEEITALRRCAETLLMPYRIGLGV